MNAAELRAYAAAERDALTHRQGAAVAVIRELRRCAIKYGKATPSVEGMAARSGYCTRSIKYATAWLAERGRLTIVRRPPHCRKDGTWSRSQTNFYRARWPGSGPVSARRPWSYRGAMDCPSTAVGTVRAPHGGARPDVPDVPDPPPPPDPPENEGPNVPPPWITEGIGRAEWLARQLDNGAIL